MKEKIINIFKKKKREKKDIIFDKVNKRLITFFASFFVFMLIVGYIGVLFPGFADFYLLYVRNSIAGILFWLFQFIPVRSSFVVSVLIVFLVSFFIIVSSKKISFENKNRYSNLILRCLFIFVFFVMALPLFIDIGSFGLKNMELKYFPDKIEKIYTIDDLIDINVFFKDSILKSANEFNRVNGEIVADINIVDTSINNLKNISGKYVFLKGIYPKKIAAISKFDHYINGYSTLGVTVRSNVFVDFSRDKVITLSTLTHELCHVKGIRRESDADFCSIVSGLESNNDSFSSYSAYLDAFERVNYALKSIDYEKAYSIENEVAQLCRLNGYNEICDLYGKDVDEYLFGTNELHLKSYSLKNYVDNVDEFILMLEKLEKKYGCEFIIYNDKEDVVSIDDIRARINDNSNEVVTISMNNNKKLFSDIQSFLLKNQHLFLEIIQIDDSYYGIDMTKEEAINYYLKPFNESDFLLLFGDKLDEEYDYYRVTRLLLDYYNY